MRRSVLVISLFVAIVSTIAPPGVAPRLRAQSLPVLQPTPYGGNGPRTLSLAQSDIADPREAQSLNPAMRSVGAGADSAFRIGAAYSPTPMALPNSWMGSATASTGFDGNLVAAVVSNFNYENFYSNLAAGLQYSRTFLLSQHGDTTRMATAGARLRYSSMGFGATYLPFTEAYIDAGLTFDLLPQVRGAAAVTNLTRLYTNQSQFPADPLTAYVGLSWQAIDDVTVDMAVESPSGAPADLHFGLEAAIDPHVLLRVGTETNAGLFMAGMGLRYDAMQLDFAFVEHPELGTTLSFGLLYAL